MKIGFSIPQFGMQAKQGNQVGRFAREVESAGAHSLWVGDRLLAAVDPKVGYGGGTTFPDEFNRLLDPFVVLTAAAVSTERVLLGTNVLIAPLYPPAVLARSLTTIDVISGGRLIAGLGIGWSPEEYAAAGVPFEHRGARFEETLDALEAIWTTDPATYQGHYVSVPRHRSELRTVRKPHPPIHLGAFNPAAIARVGRRGDGWLPVLRVPGADGQIENLRATRAEVDRAAEAAGRDPGEIATVVRVNVAHGSGVDGIAATIEAAAEGTGYDDYFVDLMYTADTVDEVLGLAVRLLDRLR
ncbi:TIGR03619 family F420-dependent LLM class oxidoreductase [Nocardia alni]|uniref:TIGR03619 family F420-dependent LLM class oxidoreductase n=1 Tax=Nocardia alni TaxID=2815723 RepID=UPI001C23BFBF|nr:TIGR03619 family F420-dependent LLM class oxidoreductase [Nocardia alni]